MSTLKRHDNRELSRSELVTRNTSITLVTQIIKNILGFITRTAVIRVLGKEVLGINSLFTEIMTVLSFAELGIGNAFVFSLYSPLASKDNEKLNSLMALYARAYRAIGVVVAIAGLGALPFMKSLVGEVSVSDTTLYANYLLFVVNSALSYFYVYKASLIIADQRNYIVLITQEVVRIFQTIIQVALLVLYGNYLVFTAVNVLATLTTNVYLAHQADRRYPFLTSKVASPLDDKEKEDIISNVKALVVYKLGGTVLGSTDSIFISIVVNVATVGMYSNYKLLVDLFTSIGTQIANSITASVGNVNATETAQRKKEVFVGMLCACAWFFGLASTGILLLSGDFIELWAGAEYRLDLITTVAIVAAFYINNMHHPCYAYRNTAGLFVYGKYVPIFASIANILLDIILGTYLGLPGIFLATVISRVFTYEIVDPIYIYKKVFASHVSEYYTEYTLYLFVALVSCGISAQLIRFVLVPGWLGFIIKTVLITICYTLSFFVLSHKFEGFKVLKTFVEGVVNRIRNSFS